ncbi:hypothetical protein [Candidatus Thiodictyon syntrophicum]|uniref:Uncharacterized protein n=1 Tax=Candidatus Thiodictyon syntrophicum TaxID=1166950 RepID=A0A2K8UEF8_9GAMM|nr:hypothetical protein [Candidatus Thiodictyon syntrophicum]AUB83932.1 hypothetical protein THSYN_25370 [Candidatus Thiodictyon syntrophicum]
MRIRHIAAALTLAGLAWGALAGTQVPPAPPVGPAAAVLGAAIDTTDPEALRDAILTPLS